MPINADKTHLWKKDIAASVDLFNNWFMEFAPVAYRETRVKTTEDVRQALRMTDDLRSITPATLKTHPGVLPTLRMSTSPPLARDRLIGLAYASNSLVHTMERGKLPLRMTKSDLDSNLDSICKIIQRLLDRDIFPWLEQGGAPSEADRQRASTIVADRLCGAVADPIVRNAQERRQLSLIGDYLKNRGYKQKAPPNGSRLTDMEPGTFTFRLNVPVGKTKRINIPIDVVIQLKAPKKGKMPLLIEAKSAGDFTNTNKRRKEEATKIHQLRSAYGKDTNLILFLCGYFDSGYLGYEAAEGLDWIWEHRIDDMKRLGV